MVRTSIRWSVSYACLVSLLGVANLASGRAQEPVVPAVGTETPTVIQPVARVDIAPNDRLNGAELLPRWLTDAKTTLAKTRDYTCFLARQELVNGKLTPEQMLELRVRTKPQAIQMKVVRPLELAGEETVWNVAKSRTMVRFRPAGIEGVRGFQTHDVDAAKVLLHTIHPANEVGFEALVARVEKIVAVERQVHGKLGVYAAEYKLGAQTAMRFEILADLPHPGRYAPRCLVYFDQQTKLPIRFEAYQSKQPNGSGPNEANPLIEMQTYLDVKLNVGLGEANFNQ